MLTRSAARTLVAEILDLARAAELEVRIGESRRGHTRFARGEPTTSGDVETSTIAVTACIDGRTATVAGNRRDRTALKELVRDAEEMAALSPVDPEHVPPLGPQRYATVARRDPATSRLGPAERLATIGAPIAAAATRGLDVAGLTTHSDDVTVVANKAGLFAYDASTTATLSATFRTPDGTGSGRAAALSHRIAGIDGPALASVAADKAELSQQPRALEPARYTVILEAQAVADLLEFLVGALSARDADEGRSFFAREGGGNLLGEELFARTISLRSDPVDGEHPASPMAGDGHPQAAVTWIDHGRLVNLEYSRHWAERSGVAALPSPTSIRMDGGKSSLHDLMSAVDRGVLVSRFWYNRILEPRTLLATGLTRDGTFLVEGGKIGAAVKNFRYNESPVTMLRNVLAIGVPRRVESSSGRVVVVPPLVVSGFHLVAVSDAV